MLYHIPIPKYCMKLGMCIIQYSKSTVHRQYVHNFSRFLNMQPLRVGWSGSTDSNTALTGELRGCRENTRPWNRYCWLKQRKSLSWTFRPCSKSNLFCRLVRHIKVGLGVEKVKLLTMQWGKLSEGPQHYPQQEVQIPERNWQVNSIKNPWKALAGCDSPQNVTWSFPCRSQLICFWGGSSKNTRSADLCGWKNVFLSYCCSGLDINTHQLNFSSGV